MSGVIFEPGLALDFLQPRNLGAVILTALAVKIADDVLDRERDLYVGFPNVTAYLGRSAGVYSLILFAIGACFALVYSVPYVLASYAIGMFGDLQERLPSGLRAWQESLIVVAFGGLIFGARTILAATAGVLCIQLLDDWFDFSSDRAAGHRNLMSRFGLIEGLAVGLLAAGVAALTSPAHLGGVMAGYLAVGGLQWAWQSKGGEAGDVDRG